MPPFTLFKYIILYICVEIYLFTCHLSCYFSIRFCNFISVFVTLFPKLMQQSYTGLRLFNSHVCSSETELDDDYIISTLTACVYYLTGVINIIITVKL